MRILLVKLSSMGDVVHNLPVATDIRRAFPDAAIDWAVEPPFAPIVSLHPAVGTVFPIPLRALKVRWWSPARWGALIAARNALARPQYDLVLDTQGLVKSAWIARRARGPVAGYDAASAREGAAARHYARAHAVPRDLHAVARNRALAAAALGYTPAPAVDYGLAPSALRAGEPPYAVCLTGTSRADKQWDAANWQALVARLRGAGLQVRLPWGSDAEHAACMRLSAGDAGIIVPPRVPLGEVATLLAGARVVVGVDTGLAHLSVALGRPTVGVYVTTQPGLTGLYGRDDCINLGGGTRDAPAPPAVDAVWSAVAARLKGA
ncbi:MAG: lipopolysaccharide heptosyltransferase I [Betaproteobacteria bacterium]|nr:lipopolysaccharide heptosyltransferase I [Betaproteobacteria bacterium]